MRYNTAGNPIYGPTFICPAKCGSTGGCKECIPRLNDPFLGKSILDNQLEEQAKNAPGIERIWEITDKISTKQWKQATSDGCCCFDKVCKNQPPLTPKTL